jgi:cytochrome c-type biogenesis protein CcsB
MKKIFFKLFSTSISGLFMILFAIAIAVATFIENDFGTSAAQKLIFRARWFEVLLVLFGISLVVNIFRYRMIQQKKWAVFTFHASILIILLGAGVTRYFGSEGMMHIRENDQSNEFLSAETYLQFEVEKDGEVFLFEKPVLYSSIGKNRWKESFKFDDKLMDFEVLGFIPNPQRKVTSNPNGVPIVKIVVAGANGREEYYVSQGDKSIIQGTPFHFGNEIIPNAISILYRNDSLLINAPTPLIQTVMAANQTTELEVSKTHELKLRSMYANEQIGFVVGEFLPQGSIKLESSSKKLESDNFGAVYFRASVGDQQKQAYIYGQKGLEGRPETLVFNDMKVKVAYGSKKVSLPFTIHLHDFIMEKYPGTDNPSSYASEVTVFDPEENNQLDYRIYMNNILNYGGYRFFQSSFDKDEMGTYLSVNHDFWGTWISYLGYFLLTLGMVMIFFSPKSRFRNLSSKLNAIRQKNLTTTIGVLLLFMGSTAPLSSQEVNTGNVVHEVTVSHAEEFGKLLVQDHKGRIKPINTLASELLRKISRKESINELTAEQVFLSMTLFPDEWVGVPLIKMSRNEKIKEILQNEESHISYNALFNQDQSYKLRDHLREAQAKKPIDRGTFEKDLIKMDERLNICNMIFTGRLLRIFPLVNDPNNTWESPAEFKHQHSNDSDDISLAEKFLPAYRQTVAEATTNNDWNFPDRMISELANLQRNISEDIVPAKSKVTLELLLNKSKIFSRLGTYYGLLGLVVLIFFFLSVFNRRINSPKVINGITILLWIGFTAHILGLAIRWYVSGHAPWSNGYESMIYISFTTMLAGIIFARKSLGGIAATTFLASIILMVANLSYLDPEITPLVPVLKSYWLTIHVSLEAGSYGFLMLGAIIGLLNLILMIFATKNNKDRIKQTVKEMTWISEMTLIGGLVMVSVGTYLGGVWANESWGRYWGWDAKETWALVTILVYAFILHMRFIPGLRGNYAFNVASLFGFASVIMTYFGVNYYLSGLHSYASGDPIPVPVWVYYTAFSFLIISLLAFWRKKVLK